MVTVCRGGGRADKATELLTQAGVAAQTMSGGMHEWARAGLPVTTTDGRTGNVA